MNKKVGVPIIIAAVIGLIVLLVILGKTVGSGPDAVKTAPPPWIDPATGKPKAGTAASSPGAPVSRMPSGGGSGAPSGGQ